MNPLIKDKEILILRDLLPYKAGSVATLDIVNNSHMRFVLMSLDEGVCLSEHTAPGDAILFALEGKAVIGYKGTDYIISEGQCFRFEKDAAHYVEAGEKFKMALLLEL